MTNQMAQTEPWNAAREKSMRCWEMGYCPDCGTAVPTAHRRTTSYDCECGEQYRPNVFEIARYSSVGDNLTA